MSALVSIPADFETVRRRAWLSRWNRVAQRQRREQRIRLVGWAFFFVFVFGGSLSAGVSP